MAFSLDESKYEEEFVGDKMVVEIQSEKDFLFDSMKEDKDIFHILIKFLTSKNRSTNLKNIMVFNEKYFETNKNYECSNENRKRYFWLVLKCHEKTIIKNLWFSAVTEEGFLLFIKTKLKLEKVDEKVRVGSFLMGTLGMYMIQQKARSEELKRISSYLQGLLEGKEIDAGTGSEETLSSKIDHQLMRVQNILVSQKKKAQNEKKELQELISEIAHQMRTPLTNLKNYLGFLEEVMDETKSDTEKQYLKIVDLTDESHSIYNQIKRGDLEGVKIGAGTHERLANVPFKITSKTTGESHIVVTDKNGQFSTASNWASHKRNTNAGKSSEDGIWFGTSEPDDSKGALLYDTYEIEELVCESNKGMKLIPTFEVVVSRNKVTIDLGTLTDEYEKEITIHTTATDKETGEKVIVAGKKVTIVDTVTLDGLEEGRKYQLKGWQMLKEENAELLIDGKRVESDYTFVADSEKMKVEISYTFDASELGGQNLVTFEELYDLKNPEEPVKVVEHKDIDDEGQTVLITERKISIHTTATDKNGKKEMEAGKDLTIVDTVTLEGLEIGTNYKLSGWQMIKEENAKLLIDGKEVTNDYEFTADKENMEVQIEFTFDGSTLGGKQLVTFEELYDMTNLEEPKKVTEHKDINDEGQTVTIKEVPETPTPESPGTTTKTSNSPKTGDTENAALWIAILVLSAAGITGVRIWNKKKQVKRLGIEEKKEEEE